MKGIFTILNYYFSPGRWAAQWPLTTAPAAVGDRNLHIKDWTWKTTFTHDSTPGMLSYNDDYHSGHVDYYGTAGKYYKAYVCIWGGKNGDGDTRYFWTSAKKAT